MPHEKRILLITADERLRDAATAAAPAPELLVQCVPEQTPDKSRRFAQVWVDLDAGPRAALPAGARRVYFHSSATVELRGLPPGLFVRKPCTAAVWRMLWSTVGPVSAVPARGRTRGGWLPDWLLSFQDLSLRKLAHKCVTRLPVRLGFQHASLYLHDPERGLLTLAESNHVRPVDLAVQIGGQRGALMSAVAREREPLLTLDVHEARRQRGVAGEAHPNGPYSDTSCLIAPLVCDGELRGVLNLSGARPAAAVLAPATLAPVLQFVARALHHARVYERAQVDAQIDPLTGLFNYRWLRDCLEREIGRAARCGQPLALIAADLDGLKDVNDSLGHAAGDFTLREVAGRILAVVRQSDCAARVGGDEFVIVLPNTDAAGADHLAQRLDDALRSSPPLFRGQPLPVTISTGTAQWTEGMDAAELLERADAAMYARKGRPAGETARRRTVRLGVRKLDLPAAPPPKPTPAAGRIP